MIKRLMERLIRILNDTFPTKRVSSYLNSNILYFISTSLLISLISSIIFKLFEPNLFTNFFCSFFYLVFYLFPVFLGYILANKLNSLENDIETMTAYDKQIYGQNNSISLLRERREKKKNTVIENDEYKYLGIKIIGYIIYIIYVLAFTIYLIKNSLLNL